jgi:hypothetical protein
VYLNGVGINNGQYSIKVYNIAGIEIDSKIIDVVNKNISAVINASSWTAGIYILNIVNDGQQRIAPIVKQ